MAFSKRLDESDELLRGIISSLYLCNGWTRVKATVAGHLRKFEPEEIRKKGLDRLLAQQLVLDIVGSEIRELWGLQDEYDASLLREPYLPRARRVELTNSITRQLTLRIDELLSTGAEEIKALGYEEEASDVLDQLIAFKKTALEEAPVPESFQDIISKALVQTLRKNDFMLRLVSSTGTSPTDPASVQPEDDSNDGAKEKKSSREREKDKDKDGVTTSLSAMLNTDGTREVTELIESYSPKAMGEICIKLRGVLLPEPLRCILWSYAFLTRNYGEAPIGVSNMRELARLAQIKGYRIGDLTSSPIADLVSRTVAFGIQHAFGASAQAMQAQSTQSTLVRLTKRVEILVHAAYILTNTFSNRVVMIAILLMKVFPDDAPVSEKVLRIFTRITLECLPSEQLHKEYSLASVARGTWLLLQQRDVALYDALQNADLSAHQPRRTIRAVTVTVAPVVAADSADAASDAATEEKVVAAAQARAKAEALREAEQRAADLQAGVSIPQSLLCLKGWLENGFLGWLPEHTALYLWDQLMLEGAKPRTFESLLPVLCFVLLELMREELLQCPSDMDLVECIKTSGRALSTGRCIEVIKGVL